MVPRQRQNAIFRDEQQARLSALAGQASTCADYMWVRAYIQGDSWGLPRVTPARVYI